VATREKRNLAEPMARFGPALFSALRNAWNDGFAWTRKQPYAVRSTHEPDFQDEKWPAALQALIGPLTTIRRRILTNRFLAVWMKLWTWILVGLIVAGAFSPKLKWDEVSAAALIVMGAIAIAILAWRARPSAYEAACRLDAVASLHDRVSTAVYLGAIENPSGMILRQREDAIKRAARVYPEALFPIRFPDAARRAVILGAVTLCLLVYRIHYKPPMVALLQSTARSQLVQSILSPIVHAMEKDLRRTMALVNTKQDVKDDKVRPGQSDMATDDLWKSGDQQDNKPEDGQQISQEANAGDQMQEQPPSAMQGGQQEASTADSEQQQNGDQQSQQGNNGSERMGGDTQQQAESQSSESKQSLSQSLMQALKNMLSNSQSQQASNQANQKQPNSPGMPQSGNSRQPGSGEADKKGDSRGSSDAQQKATQNSSSGAGSQQGSKELKKDQAAIPVNAVPDRVALESNGFKEKTLVRMDTGTGTAQLPVRDVSPQAVAVTNGAEQENIPARYRWYVQHYFEHPDSGQNDSGQK
jgi:hypothetical protein